MSYNPTFNYSIYSMKQLIAFVGFKGSGKNTAANILLPNDFVSFSFADPIKDCLSAIFCWDRQMIEGITAESRVWREQVDRYWADKLGIPDFTPRWAMTNFGTQLMRQHFNENIWLYNMERRISLVPPDFSVALIDCRFVNEIAMAKSWGGKVVRIKRGADPAWTNLARKAHAGDETCRRILKDELKIHETEFEWIGCKLDHTIDNDGTISELHQKVLDFVYDSSDAI
jgi:hypothetical protein